MMTEMLSLVKCPTTKHCDWKKNMISFTKVLRAEAKFLV